MMNMSNKINRSLTNQSLLTFFISFQHVKSISDQRARNAATETHMQDQRRRLTKSTIVQLLHP